uniref:Uncharacterized protein n=1 Tax=Rhizophora mucronata TaxID=61149 RepID=A0A2P2J0T7_RHIMU
MILLISCFISEIIHIITVFFAGSWHFRNREVLEAIRLHKLLYTAAFSHLIAKLMIKFRTPNTTKSTTMPFGARGSPFHDPTLLGYGTKIYLRLGDTNFI